MNEARPSVGLLDTSVVIDLARLDRRLLPREIAVSAVTFAELSAGPHATQDLAERARRQELLQRLESSLDPLPFDTQVARIFGRLFGEVRARQSRVRGARSLDLMIAATAIHHRMTLFTRNGRDFQPLHDLVDVRVI